MPVYWHSGQNIILFPNVFMVVGDYASILA